MKKIPIILTLMMTLIQTGTSQHFYSDAFIAQKADSYTIDAIGNEAFWAQCDWYDVQYIWIPYGGVMADGDFSGRVKFAWTAEKLLVLAEIEDNVLSDTHADPQNNYWNDDCFEVFLDEDYSGGWHQSSYNAFAYHCAINEEDVIDSGDDNASNVLVNDHVEFDLDTIDETHFIWELAITIYDDTFNESNGSNSTVTLTQGKEMGIAVAYCDNDGRNERENFIGLINVAEEHFNSAWQDASVFGKLTLNEEYISLNESSKIADVNTINIFMYSNSELIIQNSKSSIENIHVSLFDTNGRLILEITDYLEDKLEINLNGIKRGLYIVKVNGESINFAELINLL